MRHPKLSLYVLGLLSVCGWLEKQAAADGKLFAPRDYRGSLEEQSQEAIIVFSQGDKNTSAVEDLILKIRVVGPVEQFAWVVPLPNQPVTAQEDNKLFEELFRYVEARRQEMIKTQKFGGKFGGFGGIEGKVEVLSREVVGSYDVAVVRERKRGALNDWLIQEGYQGLENADDVIGFYRDKGYVFACVKVTDAAVADLKEPDPKRNLPNDGNARNAVDLHPLRFTFETGGRDGIYFPMKMTGLQTEPFDVNLYVFYRAWINDRLNDFGYEHQGFLRQFRDWDSPKCTPNAGKLWCRAQHDPYLGRHAKRMPTVVKFFKERHMGKRFYLTNIQALDVKPDDVRRWENDLWLFPYYTDRSVVPYDARPGGPAATAGAQ